MRMTPQTGRTRGGLATALLALLWALTCVSCQSPTAGARGLSSSFGEDTTERQDEALRLAAKANREDDPDRAIEMYREVVMIYRDLYPAWNNLGTLLMEQDRYLEAAEAFNTAASMAPRDPRPVYNIGLLYDRSGYLDDARDFYGRALRRDENYLPALRGMIRADSILNEDDERTLGLIRRALRLERNEKWREWLRLRQIRIENNLDDEEGR